MNDIDLITVEDNASETEQESCELSVLELDMVGGGTLFVNV